MRQFRFTFTVDCASQGDADITLVENMIDLVMQELVYDDNFVAALDEQESITIQVERMK